MTSHLDSEAASTGQERQPDIPVPPGTDVPEPVREPPDPPRGEPNAPVREPGPEPPRRL